MGRSEFPWVMNKSIVAKWRSCAGSRCDADWIGRCGNPRRSLEDRSCLLSECRRNQQRVVSEWRRTGAVASQKSYAGLTVLGEVNKVPKAGAFGLRQHCHLCCAALDMAA